MSALVITTVACNAAIVVTWIFTTRLILRGAAVPGHQVRITADGASMATELSYGHNPLAYLCRERADRQPFQAGAVCIKCGDGFEALHWKTRALQTRAEIAAEIRTKAENYESQGRVETDWLTVAHMLRSLADTIENPR